MEYAVVLHFDDKSTEQIQKITDYVAECTDNNYMLANHIRPHITIANFYTGDNIDTSSIASDIAASIGKFDIEIVAMGIFNPAVIFAAPVLNEALFKACEAANKILKLKGYELNQFYTPYHWVPHISLAVKQCKSSIQKAVNAALEEFQPIKATVENLSIAVCNPYKEIKTFDL